MERRSSPGGSEKSVRGRPRRPAQPQKATQKQTISSSSGSSSSGRTLAFPGTRTHGQLRALEEEHARVGLARLGPGKRQQRKCVLERAARISDFAYEHALRRQVIRGLGEDVADDVEAIAPGCECF